MVYHRYYPTFKPSNHTDDNAHFISSNFFLIMILLGGISCICLYAKYYMYRKYERRQQNAINNYEEPRYIDNDNPDLDQNINVVRGLIEEENNDIQPPNINNFNRNRRPNRILPPPPPAYETGNLNTPEPPSYDSIVNLRTEAENSNASNQTAV